MNRYIELSAQYWEKEYSDFYGEVIGGELLRYREIAGMIEHINPAGSVLDLGCGIGTVKKYLPDSIEYYGVDISYNAIEQARKLYGNCFEQADIQEYNPPCLTDIVLFNETLYYVPNVSGLLKRYVSFLKPSGRLIISVYHPDSTHRSFHIFNNLVCYLDGLAEFAGSQKVIKENNKEWVLWELIGHEINFVN